MHGRRGHRQLRAWELGMELAEVVYRVTHEFPSDERYGLTSQMRRAAVAIPSNVAEGYGRGGKDFVRFVRIAYGSLLEVETQIELATRLRILAPGRAATLQETTSELGKILNGLHRSLVAALP